MSLEYILNGKGFGAVGSALAAANMDVGVLRPFIGKDNRSYISVNEGGVPKVIELTNNAATLRRDDWVAIDNAVIQAAQPRLRLVADLRASGLEYNYGAGMAKTVLETSNVGDINPASVSMDATRLSESDRPIFDTENLPLPIIHKNFSYPLRQILASRNGGSPLDTTTAALAGRKCAEEAEKMAIGIGATFRYGGGAVYGITNYPKRVTFNDLTAPTTAGWSPAKCVQEVLKMVAVAQAAFHYGPYKLYLSNDWNPYMDDDYSQNKGDATLRERLLKIQGIQDVVSLDYLSTGFQMVLVQQTPDVIREVVGMDFTTIQWEANGGMVLNFMVLGIMVPQLRADQNGNTGIVHGVGA